MPVRRASLLLLATVFLAAPAVAQESGGTLDQRVTRVEKELRAVQRKVFPGGETQFLQPEIQQQAAPAVPAGSPASSPVADLSARVDALEGELTRLTAQSEQNGYQLRQLQDGFDRYRAATDARLAALEARGVAAAASPVPASGADTWPPAAAPVPQRAPDRAPPPAAAEAPEPAPPAAAPSTGDPAHDAYLAGYNLWTAKRYGDAEAALADVAAKYPGSKWVSYAQNLRGRAFLDDGKPAEAARALYANYHDLPRGDRAPDSLYYLGQSLMALTPPKKVEACKVYAELDDVYGPTLKDPLKSRAAQGEKDAGCKR